MTLEPPTLAQIEAARARILGGAVRTPLVRLPDAPGDVWLKLETLQPIGSFKIRGAGNALPSRRREALAEGVYTASAGNMAQGVAWCARELGIGCTVVVPDHAPATKLRAVERLGAAIIRVPFERWWRVLEERRFEGLAGWFVHPVSDPAVIAGNATIGLEIAEDLPGVARIAGAVRRRRALARHRGGAAVRARRRPGLRGRGRRPPPRSPPRWPRDGR